MARKARKNVNSSISHIMVQGINKEYIFNTEHNIKKYKKIILEELDNSMITILAYCIMNNHTHFLTFYENIDMLSKFMHKINSKYSRYYNQINNRVGYVFRDRFRLQEIMDIDQLYKCLKYIHNNPVKANICNSMNEYKYSSFNEFLGKKEIINEKSIELLFGNKTNFEDIFNLIHENYNDESFIDVKEKSLYEFINEYTDMEGIRIENIKNDKCKLELFIKNAKEKTEATIKELSTVLKVPEGQVKYYMYK